VADLHTFFSQVDTDEGKSKQRHKTQPAKNKKERLLSHSREDELNSM
jgi:hypothetical protein